MNINSKILIIATITLIVGIIVASILVPIIQDEIYWKNKEKKLGRPITKEERETGRVSLVVPGYEEKTEEQLRQEAIKAEEDRLIWESIRQAEEDYINMDINKRLGEY